MPLPASRWSLAGGCKTSVSACIFTGPVSLPVFLGVPSSPCEGISHELREPTRILQSDPVLRSFMTPAKTLVPSTIRARVSAGFGRPACLLGGHRPNLCQRVTCSVSGCSALQVHRGLLLHPFLCGRPAGRGPLLPQLQSSPGHLQALVGLGQTCGEPRAAGSVLRLSPRPAPGVGGVPPR